MLDFLFPWRSNSELPLPDSRVAETPTSPRVLSKTKWRKREISPNAASLSIPEQPADASPHLVSYWQYPYPSPDRPGPSNVAWLGPTRPEDGELRILTRPRVGKERVPYPYPIERSVSSPPTSPSYDSPPSSAAPQWNSPPPSSLKYSRSTHSLRLDTRNTFATNLYGYTTAYPLVRQLSPIAEKDSVSPMSLGQSNPLPPTSDHRSLTSTSHSRTSFSPEESQISDITRPSPVYSHPFISRPLNRTVSQTSSRTHVSTSSSTTRHPTKSSSTKLSPTKSSSILSSPPSIPPLDLRPPFPGPHPSYSGDGPPPRQLKPPTLQTLPTITASTHVLEQSEGEDDDNTKASLHAESFVTASDSIPGGMDLPDDSAGFGIDLGDPLYQSSQAGLSSLPSVSASHSLPSTSESFIRRRWDRDASLGTGVVTFKVKRQWMLLSPGFWAFWLGFVFPPLWLVGGWHFTNFGEQPPRLTFWEFYFNAAYWSGKLCCCRRRARKSIDPPLPQWVKEKQGSESRRARLNDPKRSLRGISFGYPFVSRPIDLARQESQCIKFLRAILRVLETPNRLLDKIGSLRLTEVKGRSESGRRMFDPWIQRCRYAFCYAVTLLCLGLFISSAYLIIYYTRRLSS